MSDRFVDYDFTYDAQAFSEGSSFASWAGYDAVKKEVVFRANDGKFLVYRGVTPDAWDSYANSDSKGSAYQAFIRGKFDYAGWGYDDFAVLSIEERRGSVIIRESGYSVDTETSGTIERNYTVTATFKTLEEAYSWLSYAQASAVEVGLYSNDVEVN